MLLNLAVYQIDQHQIVGLYRVQTYSDYFSRLAGLQGLLVPVIGSLARRLSDEGDSCRSEPRNERRLGR